MTNKTTTYSDLHVRLETDVKEKAEKILDDLGVAPSGAVNMLYRQIIAHNGLPFRVVRYPSPVPDMDTMTQAEINARLDRSAEDIEKGNYRKADEFFAEILGGKYAEV